MYADTVKVRELVRMSEKAVRGQKWKGVTEVTWDATTVHNFIARERRKLPAMPQDAALRNLLEAKFKDDPKLVYRLKTENGVLKAAFWMTGRQRELAARYGDVMVFDATYQTNWLALPLACFVGVNGHGNTVLLACALVTDETAATFE
jgi:hypothetical protein